MGESVNKVHRMLLVGCALAICISEAQENSTSWRPVEFPSEGKRLAVPQVALARLTPGDADAIFFAHDGDHTDAEDEHVTRSAKSDSLQVRRVVWCRTVRFWMYFSTYTFPFAK